MPVCQLCRNNSNFCYAPPDLRLTLIRCVSLFATLIPPPRSGRSRCRPWRYYLQPRTSRCRCIMHNLRTGSVKPCPYRLILVLLFFPRLFSRCRRKCHRGKFNDGSEEFHSVFSHDFYRMRVIILRRGSLVFPVVFEDSC